MRNIFLYFTFFFFMMGCSNDDPSDYCKTSSEIIDKYVEDVSMKYQLGLWASGGSYMYNVKEISLWFITHGPKSEEELRELMINLIVEMLNRFNRNEEIRPFLSNYPFTVNNLEFSVFLVDKNGRRLVNPGGKDTILLGVRLSDGKLRYIFKNEKEINIQTRKKESYNDAVNILKETNPQLYNELFSENKSNST